MSSILLIIGGIAALISIIVGLIVILATTRKKDVKETISVFSFDEIIEAIGGLDNILTAKDEHQRVTVKLIDLKQIKQESLKDLNISAFILKDEIKLLFKNHANDFVIYVKKQKGETR